MSGMMQCGRAAILCVLAGVGCASPMLAQEPDSGHPFHDRMINAIFDKRVQAELELVEEQREAIQRLTAELLERSNEMQAELEEFSTQAEPDAIDARRQKMILELESMKQESQASLFRQLLPHQKTRLGELATQLLLTQSARKSGVGVLAPEMREYLAIDEAQAEKLKRAAERIQKKLAEQVRKLTEQAKEELMKELSAEQQSKYRKLVGDPMDK